jgi:hypothetical protein
MCRTCTMERKARALQKRAGVGFGLGIVALPRKVVNGPLQIDQIARVWHHLTAMVVRICLLAGLLPNAVLRDDNQNSLTGRSVRGPEVDLPYPSRPGASRVQNVRSSTMRSRRQLRLGRCFDHALRASPVGRRAGNVRARGEQLNHLPANKAGWYRHLRCCPG